MGLHRKMIRSCLTRMSGCTQIRSHQTRKFHNIIYTREVKEALSNAVPVVALESTIITHGMPYPQNIQMARKVESIIRSEKVVPATIAILNGNIHVGLSNEELEELASCKEVIKISRAELPYAIGKKLSGGTTVAGTMIVAHKAGIQVFVTGGIGGVHRGAQVSMDISADLTELGRTPVMVVSAGVKSILDIGLTLEYLETMGVCVTTLGKQGSNFPAFYTPDSGFRSPLTVSNPLEAAQIMKSNMDFNLNSGMLVGVPIPDKDAALGIQEAIDTALREAEEQGIRGKQITPFLLDRLYALTSGESLRANIALVENNARVGAQIASCLATIKNAASSSSVPTSYKVSNGPVVIGGSNFDFVVKVDEDDIELNGATHYGSLHYSHGGVGRSLADALARLGNQTRLVSAVGEDDPGSAILRETSHLDTSLVRKLKDKSTATYTAILDKRGECLFGVGDMDIHAQITPEYISTIQDHLATAPIVLVDGNIPEETIDVVLEICAWYQVPFFYEPTCLRKAVKPLSSKHFGKVITYTSPNLNELVSMANTLTDFQIDSELCDKKDLKHLSDISIRLMERYKIDVMILTLGVQGVLLTRRGEPTDPLPLRGTDKTIISELRLSSVHYPTTPVQDVSSVSGAGDCLTAAFLTGAIRGLPQDLCVAAGIQAASKSCTVSPPVPHTLHSDNIDWDNKITSYRIF